MIKKWTTTDGKNRDYIKGQWISVNDICKFTNHLTSQGIDWIRNYGAWSDEGYKVQYRGECVLILWSKVFKGYTADRRLDDVVKQFRASNYD